MPIDPSIPGQALGGLQRAQPFNPLATLGDLAQLQNYRALQQERQAQAEKLQREQQEEADVQGMAQQYADPYEFVRAVSHKYPNRGFVYQKALNENVKSGLDAKSAESKLLKDHAEMAGHLWQGVKTPEQAAIARKMTVSMDEQLAQLFQDPNEDWQSQQQRALAMAADIGKFADAQYKGVEDARDNKWLRGVAGTIASSPTPDMAAQVLGDALKAAPPEARAQLQQIGEVLSKGGDFAQVRQQVAQMALTEKDRQDIAEKTIDDARAMQTAAELARHNRAMEAHGMAMESRLAAAAVGGAAGGVSADDIKSEVRTTIRGRAYVDLGDYQTPKTREAVAALARKQGLTVVNKDVGDSLRAADTARMNTNAMWQQIKSKLPKDASGRILAGPGNKLQQYFQTDADLAAFNSWRAGAIQAVQALVERGMGFRLNQAEINMIMQNDMPQITDDVPTAYRRVKNVIQLLNNKEDAALTKDRSALATGSDLYQTESTATDPKAKALRDKYKY